MVDSSQRGARPKTRMRSTKSRPSSPKNCRYWGEPTTALTAVGCDGR